MASSNFSSFGYSFPLQFSEPTLSLPWIGVTTLAALVSYGAFVILKPDPLAKIPAVGAGRSSLFSAFPASNEFYTRGGELLIEGHDKYKDRPFRIMDGDRRWHIIVSRPDQIEEIRKASDDVLSFKEFINETVFLKHIMGRALVDNEYHVDVLRFQLTRNLASLFDELQDEIEAAFADNIPPTDDWTAVHAYSKILQLVTRATNRTFIGLPVCRETEYLKVIIEFAMTMNKCRETLVRVPAFLRPLVGRYMTTIEESIAIVSKYLKPLIEERLEKMEEYGPDYPDKPADLLTWFLEVATGDELSVRSLTNRFLGINFAAISTTSMSFTHALYHLAAEPHYIGPLREEIETVVAKEGWSKLAMTKMRKLDSFFKESQRFNGSSYVSLTRLALKNFTFSDGTFVPKGTFIGAAAHVIHRDDERYPDSDKFDGFRFAKIRMSDDDLITTNQFVNTSTDYLPFGHGKHACPGRFFAAHELKAMFAHLILNYDVKMENEGVRPPNMSVNMNPLPNLTAQVLFRRRQSTKSA